MPALAGMTALHRLTNRFEPMLRFRHRSQESRAKGEEVFKTQFAGKQMSETQWLDAMAAHPILIERPVIVRGARAVIGRPPEKALELL